MEEAQRKAARTTSLAERDAYLKIAEGWRGLERTATVALKRGN